MSTPEKMVNLSFEEKEHDMHVIFFACGPIIGKEGQFAKGLFIATSHTCRSSSNISRT